MQSGKPHLLINTGNACAILARTKSTDNRPGIPSPVMTDILSLLTLKIMRRPFNNGWTLSIFLALACLLSAPVNTLSATLDSSQTAAKSLSDSSTAAPDENLHPGKRERKLSAFFKIGIALNIIMIFSFAWWATNQWRMTKKSKDV